MSSSPHKNYHTTEMIKDHVKKLRKLKENGLIKTHELVQLKKLESELTELKNSEINSLITTLFKE